MVRRIANLIGNNFGGLGLLLLSLWRHDGRFVVRVTVWSETVVMDAMSAFARWPSLGSTKEEETCVVSFASCSGLKGLLGGDLLR